MQSKTEQQYLKVIAIGISTEDIEALQDVFSSLPPIDDTCFLIAQYLSPSQKNKLEKLLSPDTNLTVKEADQGARLESHIAYYPPPDRNITIEDHKIILSKPSTHKEQILSIDLLFTSLAKADHLLTIAVVLSGKGNDGTIGIKALRKAGSLIIVQDPDTAKYNSMPTSAIQTNCVHFVLSPEEIGSELYAYMNDSPNIKERESSNEQLLSLNENLRRTIEQLELSNKTLKATNEKLQSANNEAQITFKELQSAYQQLEAKADHLYRREKDQKALLNSTSQAFFLINSNYNIVLLNSSAEKLAKFLSNTTIQPGNSILDIITHEHLDTFKNQLNTGFKGESISGKFHEINDDNEKTCLTYTITPIFDKNGQVETLSIEMTDVTESQKSQINLKQTKNLLNSIYNASTIGICITDEKGNFIDVNSAYCDIYGYKKEELIGQHFTIVVPDEYKNSLKTLHDEFIDGKEELDAEWVVQRKDGKIINIYGSAKLLKYEDGSRFKVTSIKDISERKKYKNFLEDDHTVESLGGWEYDLINHTFSVTNEVNAIFNIKKDEDIDLHKFNSIFEDEAKVAFDSAIRVAIEVGKPFDLNLKCKTSNDTVQWVRVTSKPLIEHGKTVKIYGTIQNISERIKLEEQLVSTLHELNERNKEQTCLYNIARLNENDLTIGTLLEQSVDIIKKGFQFPEAISISIIYKGKAYGDRISISNNDALLKSNGNSPQNVDLVIYGQLKDHKNETIDLSFLPEEGSLINAVADMLRTKIHQKITLNSLKASEASIQRIFSQSKDIICTIDAEGRFQEVSQASEEILGYTNDQLRGKKYIDLVHPDDHLKTIDAAQKIQAGISTTGFDNRYIRNDGSIVDLQWSARWDEQDNLMYCTARDATEIKKAKLHLELLVDNTEEAFIMTDKDLKIISYNKQFSQLYMKYFNMQVEKDVSILNYARESRKEVLKGVYESVFSGNHENTELKVTGNDDKEKLYSIRYKPATNYSGEIIGAFITVADITKQREAFDKLKFSENKYRSLFNSSPLPIIIYRDDNYTLVDANDTACRELGWSKDLDNDDTFLNIIHPDDTDHFIALNNSGRKGSKDLKFGIIRLRGTKKKEIKVDITGHKLTVDDKDCVIAICKDVTEREETFQALQKSEARYRGFYESQTNYVIRTDIDGNYTYYNKKFYEDFGWHYKDQNDIIGSNCLITIVKEDHNKVHEVVEKCVANVGKVIKVELEKEKQDGSRVITLWDFICIPDKDGNPVEIQCMGIDITDRINFERELLKSNERYRLVNKVTNDAIYDWDIRNDIFHWGEGYRRLLGYTIENQSFHLKDWIDLTHPSDALAHKDRWNDFFSDPKQQLWTSEFRFRKSDGTYLYVEEMGHLIRSKSGKPIRMIGVLRDKSNQKQKEFQNLIEHNLAEIFKLNTRLSETLFKAQQYLTSLDNYSYSEVWLLSYDKKNLNLYSRYYNDVHGKTFAENSKDIKQLAIGDGLPGSVWQKHKIKVWDEIHESDAFIRHKSAKKAQLRTAIGIPLSHNKEFIGVLILGSTRREQEEQFNIAVLEYVENYLGAEIKRKQQEEELSLFFLSAPDILAIASPDGKFVKVNPAFCNLLGYSEKELTGQLFQNFIHPDDLESTLIEYRETISGARLANSFVNRYKTKSGKYRWISWSSSNVFGEEGYAYAYGRDITAVKELQQLFESAANLARIGSWEVDFSESEKGKTYWSSLTKAIHEVEADYNPNIEDGINFYADESKPIINKAIKVLIETGKSFDLELLLITAKGRHNWVRCIGESERDGDKCLKIYGSIQDIHDRKLAELKLLRFANIIENSQDGIALADAKGNPLYINPIFSKMLGHTAESLHKQGGVTSIYADPNVANEVFKTLLSGKYWKGDIELLSKKGKVLCFYLSGGPILDNKGDLVAIYGIHTDISKRKEAENKLSEAYREKNTILESIGDAFYAVDKNWIITYWNKQAENVLGKPRSEVLGKDLWNVYADAVGLKFFSNYHKAMDTGQNVHFEEYYPSTESWYEVSVYPSEKGLSVYFKDVSIRKKAEESIKQTNERFRKVTQATNDAIWDWDIKNNSLYLGEGFKTLFGYDPKELEPDMQTWTGHIHPDDLDMVLNDLKKVLANPKVKKWQKEYRYLKINNSYAEVEDRGLVIRNSEGKATRMVGAMTDITYRKEYELSLKKLNLELAQHTRQLEISNSELEQFAYVASHDLQEPLRMITSFLTQLEKKYKDQLDDKANQYIYFAVDGAQRMRQIILDLLQYSRVGRSNDKVEEIDLNALIADYCILRKKLIAEKSATVQFDELPMLKSYKAPITQVFHNLLDNAIKYNKEGVSPKVYITGSDKGTHWQFQVKDNGIGIEKEYFDKVFVIFQRLHNKDELEGTGMGLAIVKKIINSLGGEIWVESERNKGSSFFFTIKKTLLKET